MASTAITVRDFRKDIPGGFADSYTWEFPTVNSVNVHGKALTWKIMIKIYNETTREFVKIDDGAFDCRPLNADYVGWIKVDSGIVGGKIKISSPTYVKSGKNIGKKSETNVFTQALRDAYGLYNKQAKKAQGAAPSIYYSPMLSQVLSDQKKPLVFPVYVQRKYNGVRTVSCMSDGSILMYSRRLNLYPGFGYIKQELMPILRHNLYLDGEIYKHGEALQDISGRARRDDPNDPVRYDYMIYDCFDPQRPNLKYTERKAMLDEVFAEATSELRFCKPVETFEANSMDEINVLYNRFLSEGYEGAMIRMNAKYDYSINERHSKYLLKMKPVHDAEYTIVGWETGSKGKAASAVMIICETITGHKFPVTPAMELTARTELAAKMGTVEANSLTHFENHWKGRPLIVQYDELSKDGVPQRGRTKMEIRTWE
jgi:ATP-dependent DNA ligase